jgi:hypothetical protein
LSMRSSSWLRPGRTLSTVKIRSQRCRSRKKRSKFRSQSLWKTSRNRTRKSLLSRLNSTPRRAKQARPLLWAGRWEDKSVFQRESPSLTRLRRISLRLSQISEWSKTSQVHCNNL